MPYDLNGREQPRSRLQRLFSRPTAELTPDDPGLVPVAGSTDDTAAASAVLDAATEFDPQAQSVLWHLLAVPPESVGEVLRLVEQDRYVRVPAPDDASVPSVPSGAEAVALARAQLVDALHVSQERSRMAGVTARHGGHALMWRVLQVRAER